MDRFVLHPTLARDTREVLKLALSRVLLMNDAAVPWLILVPERPHLRELHQLEAPRRAELMEEIALAGTVLERLYRPDKLNVGALGNLVPQLHLHVVARFAGDRAWPGPIWGSTPGEPYPPAEMARVIRALREALGEELRGRAGWPGGGAGHALPRPL